MSLFTGTLDSVTTAYLKADGVNRQQSVGRITFTASSLMIDGNLLYGGHLPLVVIYPDGELPLTLSGPGEVSATIDVPPGVYDGTIVLRVRDISLEPPYLNGSISLGYIDVTPPLTAFIFPIPLADGRHLLKIENVTYDEVPLTTGTVTVEDQVPKGPPITIDLSQPPPQNLYGPYELTHSSIFYLKYADSVFQFNLIDSVTGTLSASNVTSSGATITWTPAVGEEYFYVNSQPLSNITDGIYTYKLYDSTGTLIDTVEYNVSVVFTLSGLSSGTEYTYTVKYADTQTVFDGGNTIVYNILSKSTLSVTFTTGGGGSDGDGNNGDNGHNNMAAALEYNYSGWEADVTQTNTITVLGEDSAALTVDETITVNVPLANFKECVVYESSWTLAEGEADGEQPLPKVAFRPSDSAAAQTPLNTMFVKLKAKMDDKPLAERVWNDDASASHDSFGKRLISNVTFTGSVFDSQDLPKVAIRSIAEGDINVDVLTTTVAPVDTSMSAHKAYLEGLFEQLVAANRIKKDDGASGSSPAGWSGGAKCPSLVVGDSLSFKVKYNFSKTREYEVDGDVTNDQTKKALTLTIGGSTFTIQTGADGTETSNPYSRTYEIKLVATA